MWKVGWGAPREGKIQEKQTPSKDWNDATRSDEMNNGMTESWYPKKKNIPKQKIMKQCIIKILQCPLRKTSSN